jgi:predicted ribosomally synthesized peptide with nif11-like leader
MSVENVVTFLDRLKMDEELATEYARVTRNAMQEALRNAVVEVASKHGCRFTADELDAHLDQVTAELDDDELDQVAGGGVEPSPFMPVDPLKGQAGNIRNLARFLRPRGGAGWDPGDISHR